MENIRKAIKGIVDDFEDVNVIYPIHLNPAVRETVYSILGKNDRIKLIVPIDVEGMHNLMARYDWIKWTTRRSDIYRETSFSTTHRN